MLVSRNGELFRYGEANVQFTRVSLFFTISQLEREKFSVDERAERQARGGRSSFAAHPIYQSCKLARRASSRFLVGMTYRGIDTM
jgi:hypothetical protein